MLEKIKEIFDNNKMDEEDLQEYNAALKEYESIMEKYKDSLSDANSESIDLSFTIKRLKDEKMQLEKNLEFAKADKKLKEIKDAEEKKAVYDERVEIITKSLLSHEDIVKKERTLYSAATKIDSQFRSIYYKIEGLIREYKEEVEKAIQDERNRYMIPLLDRDRGVEILMRQLESRTTERRMAERRMAERR